MPRRARIVASGLPHHIIQRGNNRCQVFFDDEDYMFYLECLLRFSQENDITIHAYCLMTNHVHLLAVPNKKESLARMMQKVSLVYTQHINKKYKRTGRMWECRFHSCIVDTDSYFLAVCRYIERNPVRARIVKSPTQYKWSSAKVNTSAKVAVEGSLVVPIWSTEAEREKYKRYLGFVDQKTDESAIEKSLSSGIPLGTEKFISYLEKKLKIDLRIRPAGRPKKQNK